MNKSPQLCQGPDYQALLAAARQAEPQADEARLLKLVMTASRGACNPARVVALIREPRTQD